MGSHGARPEQLQATVGWVLTATIALVALFSTVTESFLWGGFVLAVAAVASLPAILTRNWAATVPWPLLALAALAALTRAAGISPEFAGYLVIVALALIVVIELDGFTRVELSRRFAVVFGVMVTMALEAVWIVAQHYSDRYLGTELLHSQVELQWDIVTVTFVSITVGLLYQMYATRYEPDSSVTIPSGERTR